MGYGDEIMASGWAKEYCSKNNGMKIMFKPYSEVYLHNPNIIKTPNKGDKFIVTDFNRKHGYKDDVKSSSSRYFYKQDFRAYRGDIYLSPEEKAFAEYADKFILPMDYIIIEPNIKGTFSSDNKDWGFDKWQSLVNELKGSKINFVQIGKSNVRKLNDVRFFETQTFRKALAIISKASGIVTTEGAIHHAAAAFNIHAVVIWGSFTNPKILGYKDHSNLYHHNSNAIGWRKSNDLCKEGMRKITVNDVAEKIERSFLENVPIP